MKLNLKSIDLKSSFTNKKFKNGAYMTVLATVVIIMVLLLNLFVQELHLSKDISSNAMYTLTGDTKKIAKGLSDDVILYYVVQEGKEDAKMERIIKQYPKLSKKIKVVKKDPSIYPKFTSKYTNESVTANSVIVLNKKTGSSKYVAYETMMVSEMNPQTYMPDSQPSTVDVEGQITSAIQYVTSKDLPVMYTVEGHGEGQIASSLATEIAKLNVKSQSFKTLTEKEVPSDCEILLINAPMHDFTKEEAAMIESYLKKGGKAIIITGFTKEKMPNLNGILKYYGVALEKGVVLEQAGNCIANNPNYLIPTVENHDITAPINQDRKYVITVSAQGIKLLGSARSTVQITPLLKTSEGAYSKTNEEFQTIEKEKGDIDGPFNIGVAITEKNKDTETKLAVYSTSNLLEEGILNTGQFGNADLLLNSISWMSGKESGLTIPKRSIKQNYLTVTPGQANFWSAFLIVVLPLTLLITGFVIWMKRRKS